MKKRRILKLWKLRYGDQFYINHERYTYERGDGMYPWVRRHRDDRMMNCYIGTLVEIPND